MTNPRQTLAAGYAASTPPDPARQSVARTWRPDLDMEALAKLCIDDPNGFATLPAQHRMALGMYEQAKAAAETAGIDTFAAVLNAQAGRQQGQG
ncbi:hypothetical protein ACQEVZ_38655 [Dactylosporangium sp. CA-152071]|uniref:hypothetical protein n=1 Tax=Dactylosporangium sp. CA-152071 TaxID=3239933 RepID=UPI003D94C8A3